MVSDIHCSYTYTVRAAARAVELRSDLILFAGDLECSDLIDELVGTGIRVVAVTGNLDDAHVYRVLRMHGVLADGSIVEHEGLAVAGIGALNYSQSLERVLGLLGRGAGGRLVVLSHYPPQGINDRTYAGVHTGLPELRRLIEEHRPVLFVHGHVHEAHGVSVAGGTTVVNPGPLMHGFYGVAEISNGGVVARVERL